MKVIKYQIMKIVDAGSENERQVFRPKHRYSDEENLERNIAVAISEAYNGEYTVEDDGEPEPPPTEQEQLRADVDFLLAMGGVL